LKSVVGGDTLEGEIKGSSKQVNLQGRFNVIVTGNEDLTVDLDGDTTAWERRLAVVYYEKPYTGKPIPDLEERLLREEGPGILNWCIKGAERLLREIATDGKIAMTEAQRQHVSNLLQASDGLRLFLQENLIASNGSYLTTDSIVEEYAIYCRDRNWPMLKDVEGSLPKLMLELFMSCPSHSIFENGRYKRGYRGVKYNNG